MTGVDSQIVGGGVVQTCRMTQFVVGPDIGESDTGSVTIYDLQGDANAKVRVRALPRLVLQALRIAWAAGRGEFIVSTLLQLVGGGGIAVLLVLGQQGLDALLEAIRDSVSLVTVAPWAIAIASVAGIQFFVTAAQQERQEILGELMQRRVEEGVLDVATHGFRSWPIWASQLCWQPRC
jgi:hypothetical protein